MKAEFWGIKYSPWSNRARWALDHHRIAYHYQEYTPLISTPLLRIKTLNLLGKITVPTLIHKGKIFSDSWDIARYAERLGNEAPLFPEKTLSKILAINSEADILTHACRTIVTDAVSKSEEAKEEALPNYIPEFMRSTMTPLADLATAYLGMKYDFRHSIITEEKKKVRKILDSYRGKIGKKKGFIFDTFTYADIVIATSLEFISPVDNKYIPIGTATRTCFTQPELAEEFADLLSWRDAMYQKCK